MPPELRGLSLCARCRHREACAPFRDEIHAAVENIARLEVASHRHFGPREICVETLFCLTIARDSTDL